MSKKHKKKPNNFKKTNMKSQPQSKQENDVSSDLTEETLAVSDNIDEAGSEAILPEASGRKTLTSYDQLRTFAVVVLIISGLFALSVACMHDVLYSVKQPASAKPEELPDKALSYFSMELEFVVNSLVSEEGLKYEIDEDYHDLDSVITYVTSMTGKKADDVSAQEIKENLFKVFVPIKTKSVIKLVQKDNETLIWECENRTLMNKLDYEFMGTTNKRIEEASRGFYISQNDDKFLKYPYGDSNIKYAGCGPVSLTMALNYVNNKEVVTLDEVVTWAEENNMYEHMSGTRWALMRTFPLAVESGSRELYIRSAETLEKSITEDSVLIVSMNKGHFTNDGHFMIITEVKDGMVSVLDPSSICRSLKKWDAQTIVDESNKYFWRINKSDL